MLLCSNQTVIFFLTSVIPSL